MKRVFDDNAEWTDDADKVANAIRKALKDVFDTFPDVNPRELFYIAVAEASSEHLARLVKFGKK